MSRQPAFAFPFPDLYDNQAAVLVDFLSQLAAQADAYYPDQIAANQDAMRSYPTFVFPDICPSHAATLCDFLCALALAADSRYLAQIIRYRNRNGPLTVDSDRPWWRQPADDS